MLNWFKKFLEKLEKANKESFGSGKLDCCDLSKQLKNSGAKQQGK